MNRRLPLRAVRRVTEIEADELRARLLSFNEEVKQCEQELDAVGRQLMRSLEENSASISVGALLSPRILLLRREQTRSLHFMQIKLQNQQSDLIKRRDETAEALSQHLAKLKAIDAHHEHVGLRITREEARSRQAELDELWIAGRTRQWVAQ